MSHSCKSFLGLLLLFGVASIASAQDHLSFKGTIFSDYSYQLTSPDDDQEGYSAFGFRRVRLTTDYVLSDRFSGRLRFEGKDSETTTQGAPAAFVKDAYIRWNDALGNGHRVTFGLFRPPIWWEAEDQWGYRVISKTIQDRVGVAKSRDMGLMLNGPLNDQLGYAIMIGNNSGGKQETDKYKRAYGQLTFTPDDNIVVTAGADYYAFDGGSSISFNGFAGYTTDRARVGVEGFYNPKTMDDVDGEDVQHGLSVFGNYDLNESHRLVVRFDRNGRDDFGMNSQSNWATAGLAFLLDTNLQIIPNLIYENNDADDSAAIMARLTVWAIF